MEPIDKAGQRAPGAHSGSSSGIHYIVGGFFAFALTIASFVLASSNLVYGPALPVLLGVLAIAQMGVHLVFFLHVSSGPDNTNNVLALAFGVLIVGLVVFGSLIIVSDLNTNMMSSQDVMRMEP